MSLLSKVFKGVKKAVKNIFKGASKIVKGAIKGVKTFLGSDFGKLLVAAAVISFTYGVATAPATASTAGSTAATGGAVTGAAGATGAAAGGVGGAAALPSLASVAPNTAAAISSATAPAAAVGTNSVLAPATAAAASAPISAALPVGAPAAVGAAAPSANPGLWDTVMSGGKSALNFTKDYPMATYLGGSMLSQAFTPNAVDEQLRYDKATQIRNRIAGFGGTSNRGQPIRIGDRTYN